MKPTMSRRVIYLFALAAGLALPGCATSGKAVGERGGRSVGEEKALKVGERAPNFKLKMLDDDAKKVRLASFRNKKPVVLFFGSYT